MAINPLFVFDDFDPLTGEGPEKQHYRCEHIIHRCREILSQRTKEDIYTMYDLNRYILSEHHSVADALNKLGLEAEAEDKGENIVKAKRSTNSEPLLECIEKFELDSEEISDLKWSEMFAVQALSFISLARTEEREYDELEDHLKNIPIYEYETLYCTDSWSLDAMESLGYAEMHNALENKEKDILNTLEINAAEKISLRSRQAAIARHAKSTALKQEFIEFYKQREYHSMSHAADRFLAQLDDIKIKILVPSNAKRTLTDALSKHLKLDDNN